MTWVECVVADSPVHARAMRHWLGLDDSVLTRSYGSHLPENMDLVHLVRPLRGPSPTHLRWIVDYLKPRTRRIDLSGWGRS